MKEVMVTDDYLVLNMEDELDTIELLRQIKLRYEQFRFKKDRMKIKDIAVGLVNAILKAKGGS